MNLRSESEHDPGEFERLVVWVGGSKNTLNPQAKRIITFHSGHPSMADPICPPLELTLSFLFFNSITLKLLHRTRRSGSDAHMIPTLLPKQWVSQKNFRTRNITTIQTTYALKYHAALIAVYEELVGRCGVGTISPSNAETYSTGFASGEISSYMLRTDTFDGNDGVVTYTEGTGWVSLWAPAD